MDRGAFRFYINRNADSVAQPCLVTNLSAIQSLHAFDTFTTHRLSTGFSFQPRAEGDHEHICFLSLWYISTVTAGGKKGTGEWCDQAAACEVIRYQSGRSHRDAYAVECGLQREIEMIERQRRGWFEIGNARSGEPVAP